MKPSTIPDDVRRFILTSIVSVPHLEALLLLHGAKSSYTGADVSARLYIPEARASEVLNDLHQTGFLSTEGGDPPAYRYAPISPEQISVVDRVATAYAQNLVEVTNLIHERPLSRLQQFADAFRLRKD